jgi:hypothetical protein
MMPMIGMAVMNKINIHVPADIQFLSSSLFIAPGHNGLKYSRLDAGLRG